MIRMYIAIAYSPLYMESQNGQHSCCHQTGQ